MIIDNLNRAHLYVGAHPYLEGAFALANKLIAENAPGGKYFGDNGVFASVSEYDSKIKENPNYENHHDYIDIQIIVSGKETMLAGNTEETAIAVEYKPDVEFYYPPKCFQNLTIDSGKFAIFFPGDAHAPGLAFNGESAPVKKVLVKIPVK